MAVIALPTRIARANTRWIGRACLWYVNWRGRHSGTRYVQMRLASDAAELVRPDGMATLHGMESLGGIRALIQLFNEAYVGAPDYHRAGWIEAVALQASKSYDPTMIWIASRKNRPVGFCMARMSGEEGRITGIGVLPSYRNQGIGTTMMLRATDELKRRGARDISLSVAATNRDSVRLYHHLGFEELS